MTTESYDLSSCVALDNGVEKPVTDKRRYKHLEMPNRMRVLLISDPETDKGAAAMSVNVGHLSDPDDIPGLAHFCEHMLFLGTEKYPDENEYSKFLSDHSGMSNAYTDMEDTNYFFDVGAEHLEGALDRFAQFFLAPLFTESATERELQAVDSEHSKNRLTDMWRLFQLSKSAADPSHPYSKFGTGSAATLWDDAKAKGLDTRQALLDFHRRFYSANRMCLAVLGRQSLETLEEWVVPLFAGVEDRDAPPPTAPPSPYRADQLGRRLRVVPIRDLHAIQIAFPFPALERHYASAPHRYLSHLIGHEAPGSVLALLRARGWANELSAGVTHTVSGFSFFELSIEATEEGMARADEVVTTVFQYIAMLREHGALKWVHDEVAAEGASSFRFRNKINPSSYASQLARGMRLLPAALVVSGQQMIREWDPAMVSELLSRLVPDNARVVLVDKGFESLCTLEERWYKTKYSDEALTEEELEVLRNPKPCPELHLPARNEFLATDFALRAEHVPVERGEDGFYPQPAPPSRIVSEPRLFLWHKLDTTFSQPKVNAAAIVHVDGAYDTARQAVMLDLFVRLATEACNDVAYFAEVAGLKFRLERVVYGFVFRVDGFNHKLAVLVDKLAEIVAAMAVDEPGFRRQHERKMLELRSFAVAQPYGHAVHDALRCLRTPRWSHEEQEAALPHITFEDMRAFARGLFRRVHIEALVHGNATAEEAIEIGRSLDRHFGAGASAIPRGELKQLRAVDLPVASFVRHVPQRNPDQENSAINMVLMCGPWAPKLAATVELLGYMVSEPYFDQLRTKETLGYIVWSGVKNVADCVGMQFIVQSDKANPEYLDGRTERFLDGWGDRIAEMAEEEFELNKKALLTSLLQAPKSLKEETNRFAGEMESMHYIFDRNGRLGDALRALTLGETRAFFERHLAVSAPERRKFSSMVKAAQCKESLVAERIAADPESLNIRPSNATLDAERDAAATLLPRDEYGRYVVESPQVFQAVVPLHAHAHAGVGPSALPRL